MTRECERQFGMVVTTLKTPLGIAPRMKSRRVFSEYRKSEEHEERKKLTKKGMTKNEEMRNTTFILVYSKKFDDLCEQEAN